MRKRTGVIQILSNTSEKIVPCRSRVVKTGPVGGGLLQYVLCQNLLNCDNVGSQRDYQKKCRLENNPDHGAGHRRGQGSGDYRFYP